MKITIVVVVFLILLPAGALGQAVVTVDLSQRHQTWEGWEVTYELFHFDDPSLGDAHPIPQDILDQLLDDAVNELGINAVRVEFQMQEPEHNLEPVNDNADPFDLDADAFRWSWVDPYMRAIALPMRERVEARGERFVLNAHAVAWGGWQWNQPADDPGQEYAEFMMAALDRLKTVHDAEPDYLTVFNEPDLENANMATVIRAMRKLSDRMVAAGYDTQLRYPDASTIAAAVSWFDRLVELDPGLIPRIGQFSFHGYGGFAPSTLNAIRDRAQTHGLRTAQTEWWFETNHVPDIIAAMTEADASLYQPYALGTWPNNNPERGLYAVTFSGGTFPNHNYRDFVRGPDWHDIHHFSHFIRPGDVRIAAESDSRRVSPVAFVKPDGRVTVAVNNLGTGPVRIEGLPAGAYGIVYSAGSEHGVGMEDIAVGEGETLRADIPGRSVATVFAKSLDAPVDGYAAH